MVRQNIGSSGCPQDKFYHSQSSIVLNVTEVTRSENTNHDESWQEETLYTHTHRALQRELLGWNGGEKAGLEE